MDSISTNEIITYALSGGALLVSIAALIVSIYLPLHLAKRAEEHAVADRKKEKLPSFFREVKEFAVHFNTPAKGYISNSEYYLSNRAAELGLEEFQRTLLALHEDLNKYDETERKNHGENDATGKYVMNPELTKLGKEIQRKLRVLHDMAERETRSLYAQ